MATETKNWWFIIAIKTDEPVNKKTFNGVLAPVEWLGPVIDVEDSPYGTVIHTLSGWPDFKDIRPVIWHLQDIFPTMKALDIIFHKDNKLRTMSGTGHKAMYCADLRIEPFAVSTSAAEHMQQVQQIISTYTGELKWFTVSLKGKNWKRKEAAK